MDNLFERRVSLPARSELSLPETFVADEVVTLLRNTFPASAAARCYMLTVPLRW